MHIVILGSATSSGVPIIGCSCPVCTSKDARDIRTRASAYILINGKGLLIDTSADFRAQALARKIMRVDAVLYTHAHADHTVGIDDLRSFNYIQNARIPVYGSSETLAAIRRRFEHLFEPLQEGGGLAKVDLFPVSEPFQPFDGVTVIPIPVMHGILPIYGYRIGGFAYLTDASFISEESYELLHDLDLLVLGALRETKHPTHFSFSEAIEEIEKIKPRQVLLTHLSHNYLHKDLLKRFRENIKPSYDGLEVDL